MTPTLQKNPFRTGLLAVVFLLVGSAAAAYLHWPALTDPLIYKSDVRQSPHWAAYHTDTFQDDDLLLTLAAHNESPLMNAIYYVGTLVVDMVTLGKWLAVVGYGLTAALFFWLVGSLYGERIGALTALCFTFFPDQFDYWSGGFSKAWMIPVLLVCVYLLEQRAWRGLLFLMPFGALAYPVSAVLVGATVLAYILLEAPEGRRRVLPAFGYLCGASSLALAVLFVKYLFPPDGIGTLTAAGVLYDMPEMYDGGFWNYLPLPSLTAEMARRLGHPFVLFSGVTFLVVLRRRGPVWSRAMTALLLASMVFYWLAEQFFMHLYQPNRYTRYSLVVLLAIWHGRNWGRVLDAIPWKAVKLGALAGLLTAGGYLSRDTFQQGKDTGARHDRAALNRFLATLPPKILVAGPPKHMDDVPIQARRSVLCNFKLAHPWYSEYYDEIRRRTLATFDAIYAAEPDVVNRLSREWGVTHLVVVKRDVVMERALEKDTYVKPYDGYIHDLAYENESFLLADPPRENVVYEDHELFVVALPLAAIDGVSDSDGR